MAEHEAKRNRLYYGWVVVAATFVMFTVVFGVQYSFGIFFKPLQDAFGWSRATTSWAITLHLAVYALSTLPLGWAFDRFKPAPLICIAAVVLGASLVLSSRISEPWQLYLVYGLPLGVAVCTCGPLILTLVTRWFAEKRGLALGITAAGIGFGTLLGAPISNLLIDGYGWRNAFVILGIGSSIIILLCAFFIRSEPGPADEGRKPPAGARGTGAGLPDRSMSVREAFRARELFLVVAANGTANFTLRMVMVHIAPHAIDRGISPYIAALAIGTIGGASVVGRLVMGFMQDRIGAKRAMIICLTIQAFSMLAIPFIGWNVLFFAYALVFGFVYGGDVPQFPAIVAKLFGTGSIGAIYGLILGMGNLAGALGPIVAGYAFDLTGTYTGVFLASAVFLSGGVFCVSRLERPRRPA